MSAEATILRKLRRFTAKRQRERAAKLYQNWLDTGNLDDLRVSEECTAKAAAIDAAAAEDERREAP